MTRLGVKSALRRGLGFKRSLLFGAAVAASFATPNLASADEVFQLFGHVKIDNSPLTSFDISWVDEDLTTYFLADRTHASVDLIAILVGNPLGLPPGQAVLLLPQGANAFAGNVACVGIPGAGANDCKGPNGILTLTNSVNGKTLWVGDGNSTVKVFDAAGLNVPIHTIPTGGKRRADEMCFDPDDNILLVANDAEVDAKGNPAPFVSFIGTDNPNAYQKIGQITFDGTQFNNSGNVATNGIEQCQYDHEEHVFLLNIPEVNGQGNDSAPGEVATIDPKLKLVIGEHPIDLTQCAGPQGMARAPGFNKTLLGCNAATLVGQTPLSGPKNSVIVETFDLTETGTNPVNILCTLDHLGGADQVWFNPSDGHFFLAISAQDPQLLGVVDAGSCDVDNGAAPNNQSIVTANGIARTNHSVAADTFTGFVALPTAANAPTGYSSNLCGGDANNGCVAVFAASDNPFITGEPIAADE
jgi:hypothetical protein